MTRWRKSSYSDNGSCVEVADLEVGIAVRNSNHPDAGTRQLARGQWMALIAEVKAGRFDA